MTGHEDEEREVLAVRRVRLVLAQYEEEHGYGWQTRLSAQTGRHQTHLGRVRHEKRNPGLADVDALIHELKISPSFFFDPALGDAPSYRDFVSEDGRSSRGTPNAEAFIAGQAAIGKPLSPEATQHLRSLWHESGDVPLEVIVAMHRHWEAEQKGKAVAEAPAVETSIDEAAGQRKLPARVKKK